MYVRVERLTLLAQRVRKMPEFLGSEMIEACECSSLSLSEPLKFFVLSKPAPRREQSFFLPELSTIDKEGNSAGERQRAEEDGAHDERRTRRSP